MKISNSNNKPVLRALPKNSAVTRTDDEGGLFSQAKRENDEAS